jgi:hypothetical protein
MIIFNVLKETTIWPNPQTCNHIYLIDVKSERLAAYRNVINGTIVTFEKPLKFDKRKRTFVKVTDKELLLKG